jgi:hypothetical protein
MEIIRDPREILSNNMPLIVFSDHTSGLIEWVIKMRTKGLYNHVMLAMSKGKFVSQGNTYSEIGMERYMGRRNRLLFIEVLGLTNTQKKQMYTSVYSRIKLPWWKKGYDWLGIVGQAIGIKSLQIKGLNYCSQDIYLHLMAIRLNENQPHLKAAFAKLNPNGSPQDHHNVFLKHPEAFGVFGIWQGDI